MTEEVAPSHCTWPELARYLRTQGIKADRVVTSDGLVITYDRQTQRMWLRVTTIKHNERNRPFLADDGELATEQHLVPLPGLRT